MDKTSVRQSFTSNRYQNYHQVSCAAGHSPIKIHELLCSGLGDYAPSIQTVRKWVADIQSGQDDMKDMSYSGHPETATNNAHVQQVAALLQEDCHQIYE